MTPASQIDPKGRISQCMQRTSGFAPEPPRDDLRALQRGF